MSDDLFNVIVLSGMFLALFALGEILYHYFRVRVEFTRKTVHVGTGLLTMFFPIMLENHWWVLLLCSSFALILIISLRFNLLKSINAIDRESVGSLAYPISVYGCYLAYNYFDKQLIYYYLPILILALCDPMAALIGKRWPRCKFKVGDGYKTMSGSITFFISAVVLMYTLMVGFKQEWTITQFISGAFIIGTLSTITEALSARGYDNLTIPISVLLGLVIINWI
jgi:phytol kinase